ncbi:MAG: MBL fold metallo-hydrolase [Anaerolineae bacterium]|jgi:glyoxylase-like metal-dependent hydrolase (beta-lactamase superfamily II)
MEKIGNNTFITTVYPGVNIGCIVTDGGSICVDTPLLPGEAQRWQARIRSLEGEPVRFVVYTSGQRERILGTQYLIRLQPPLPPPSAALLSSQPDLRQRHDRLHQRPAPGKESLRKGVAVAHKLAWAQVANHCTDSFKQSMVDMLGERDPDIVDLEVICPQVALDQSLTLHVGDEEITLLAAAPGMLWVWHSEQRVLFVGDTVVVGTHPPLTVTDTEEWLAALERLRQEPQFQDATIVPGRGHLCDATAATPLMEYLRMARDSTHEVYHAGRPKADLNGIAADLLPLYPVADGQRERVQRQIKLGLDELYDEFKAADATDSEADL